MHTRSHRVSRPARVLVAGLAAAIPFVVMLVIVAVRGGEGATSADAAWMDGLLQLRSPMLTQVGRVLGVFGGPIVSGIVIPVAVAGLLLLARRAWAALFFVVASAIGAALVQIVKYAVARPRPADILVTADFGSFPSGHSANAAVVVTALALILAGRRWLVAVGSLYVALMMLSRMYLGAHWLTDTIAGASLGVGVALLTSWAIGLDRIRSLPGAGRRARGTEQSSS